jgi:hypothetical protein
MHGNSWPAAGDAANMRASSYLERTWGHAVASPNSSPERLVRRSIIVHLVLSLSRSCEQYGVGFQHR